MDGNSSSEVSVLSASPRRLGDDHDLPRARLEWSATPNSHAGCTIGERLTSTRVLDETAIW
jgi:hypothetical protein